MNPTVLRAAASPSTARRSGGSALARIGALLVGLVVAGIVAFAGALGGALNSPGLGSASAATATLAAGEGPVLLPAGGPDLSVAQIGTVAAAAGFSGSGLVMAIAVALAESGGNPTATNLDSNGSVDRGVWQINSVHTEYSAACDYDPSCAAGAAFSISAEGTNWGAWVTYQHGAEIPFLPVAVSFVEGAGGSA
jgi:Lysozyme like domain